MASPTERVPYYKLGVEIVSLILFLLLSELPGEEFLALKNYGEAFPWEDSLPEKEMANSSQKFLFRLRLRNSSLDSIYNLTALFFTREDLSFSFLTEKEKGEEFFDYTSFSLRENGKNYHWLLGDFFCREPEILLSPPYFGYYSTSLSKSSFRILEPVRFVSENHYFRGLGLELGKSEGMGGNFFLSAKSLTALRESTGSVKGIYYGRYDDSLSRANKGRLKEKSLGWGVRWQKENFRFRTLFLFSNYNENFPFGKNLFLSGFSLWGRIWGQEGKVEGAKSFPGGWGGIGCLKRDGHYLRYRLKISYQRGNFFNLYGAYPNLLKKDDQLRGHGKISLNLPSWFFSFSYHTRVNFGYDSSPSLLRMEWGKREERGEIKIYEKFYLSEGKRGSGLKIIYRLSSRIRTHWGIEDKYQKKKRGFKLSGKIIFSFPEDKITFQGYKTILNQGIDFYHLETEGYQENDHIGQSEERVALGYEKQIGRWKINFGLGLTREEKSIYDFKGEIRYERIPN
ncbi:MAG: hypothetical protein ABIK84_05700 [candidate division WOR-3 bacterium]